MKYKRLLSIFLAILTVGLTVFIFSNSMQIAEESQAASDGIVVRILEFFDQSGLKIDRDTLSFVVRKLGHFAEYFALGFACTGFLVVAAKRRRTVLVSPLYCVAVAACDEFVVQAMTEGRSPQMTDIMIDFCGVITAMTTLFVIIRYFKTKRKK